MSPHNDPSLHLLMLANLKGYRFGWPLGADNLMLVSVGTGFFRPRHSVARLKYTPSVFQAVNALTSMIADGSRLVQIMLQWASETPTPRVFDDANEPDAGARTYTLRAPGRSVPIQEVKINSDFRLNGIPFAAFGALVIEQIAYVTMPR